LKIIKLSGDGSHFVEHMPFREVFSEGENLERLAESNKALLIAVVRVR